MKKNLLIIGGVVLGLIIVMAIIPLILPEEEAQEDQQALQVYEDCRISQRDISEVTRCLLTRDGETLEIYQDENGVFQAKGYEELNIATEILESYVTILCVVQAQDVVQYSLDNLEEYGLDNEDTTATVEFNDGTSLTYIMGNTTLDGTFAYMIVDGQERVYKVMTNLPSVARYDINNLLTVPVLSSVESTEFVRVQLKKDGEVTLDMRDTTGEDKLAVFSWELVYPWRHSASFDVITEYLESIAAVEISSVYNYQPTEADLEEYGLKDPARSYTVWIKDGNTYTMHIGNEATSSRSYVMMAGDPVVYTAPTAAFGFIDVKPIELADRLLSVVNIRYIEQLHFEGLGHDSVLDVKQIQVENVTTEGNTTTTESQEFKLDGEPKERDECIAWYTALVSLELHSEVDPGWEPSGKPDVKVEYDTNLETIPTHTVEFYAYKNDFYVAVLDGATAFKTTRGPVDALGTILQQLKDE